MGREWGKTSNRQETADNTLAGERMAIAIAISMAIAKMQPLSCSLLPAPCSFLPTRPSRLRAVPGDGFLYGLLVRRGGGTEGLGELAAVDDIGFFKFVEHFFHFTQHRVEEAENGQQQTGATRTWTGRPISWPISAVNWRVLIVSALGMCQARPSASSFVPFSPKRSGRFDPPPGHARPQVEHRCQLLILSRSIGLKCPGFSGTIYTAAFSHSIIYCLRSGQSRSLSGFPRCESTAVQV